MSTNVAQLIVGGISSEKEHSTIRTRGVDGQTEVTETRVLSFSVMGASGEAFIIDLHFVIEHIETVRNAIKEALA